MKIIGKKIKEARKIKGLTQEDLAELSKMNLRTIQRIENNESIPRGKSLNLICDVLQLHIEDIVIYETKEKRTSLFNTITHIVFLLILNFVLMAIFGYMTIDSDASLNSKSGALLLSFFIPIFIVYKTQKMTGIERLLKFGLGFVIYIILVSIKMTFPQLIMTGFLPSMIIALGTLYYGHEMIKKKE